MNTLTNLTMSSMNCRPLPLRSIYVDTTFCEPKAVFIPDRVASADQAVKIIGDWICRDPDHHVMLEHKANLGYEQLYREVAATLKTKVSGRCLELSRGFILCLRCQCFCDVYSKLFCLL